MGESSSEATSGAVFVNISCGVYFPCSVLALKCWPQRFSWIRCRACIRTCWRERVARSPSLGGLKGCRFFSNLLVTTMRACFFNVRSAISLQINYIWYREHANIFRMCRVFSCRQKKFCRPLSAQDSHIYIFDHSYAYLLAHNSFILLLFH